MIPRAMLAARAFGRRSSIATRDRSPARVAAPEAPGRVAMLSVLAARVWGAGEPSVTSRRRSGGPPRAERTAAVVLSCARSARAGGELRRAQGRARPRGLRVDDRHARARGVVFAQPRAEGP